MNEVGARLKVVSESPQYLRKWPSSEAPVLATGGEKKKGEILQVVEIYNENETNWVRLKSTGQLGSGWLDLDANKDGLDIDERLELHIPHPEKFDIELCVVRVAKDVKVCDAKRLICKSTGLHEDSLVMVKRIKVDTSTLPGEHLKSLLYNWLPADDLDDTVADLGYGNGDVIALTYLTNAEDDLLDDLKGLVPESSSESDEDDDVIAKRSKDWNIQMPKSV